MKRSGVDLQAVAEWHNLAAAFARAAIGAGRNSLVERFRADLANNLGKLQRDILQEKVMVVR